MSKACPTQCTEVCSVGTMVHQHDIAQGLADVTRDLILGKVSGQKELMPEVLHLASQTGLQSPEDTVLRLGFA